MIADLAFEVGMQPSEIERMTVKQLHWWHRLAASHFKKKAQK